MKNIFPKILFPEKTSHFIKYFFKSIIDCVLKFKKVIILAQFFPVAGTVLRKNKQTLFHGYQINYTITEKPPGHWVLVKLFHYQIHHIMMFLLYRP